MKSSKLSVGLVLFKNTNYLPYFLDSIFSQDFDGEVEFLFRDQDPEKEASKFIQANYPNYAKKIQFFYKNGGYHSEGQNFLLEKSNGQIYLCLSYDAVYPEDFFSKTYNFFQTKKEAEIATCKILRWDFFKLKNGETLEKSKSNFIDSLGIKPSPSHLFIDFGQGKKDEGQFDKLNQTFGPSGAFFAVRRDFFEKVKKLDGHFFDEKFIPHYKNDVDISYRLNWHGVSTRLIPSLVFRHDRQLGKVGTFAKLKNSKFNLYSSSLGQLILLRKNFSSHYSLLIKLKTFIFELKKFFFFLFFRPKNLRVYFDFLKNFKKIKKTKKDLKNLEKIVNSLEGKFQ